MRNRLRIGLVIFCLVTGLSAQADLAQLPRAHSHNDYLRRHPLFDALAQGFSSVEADVYLRRGELKVSHLGLFFRGTLEDLYLRPLQSRVDRLGSVYGDGKPFFLWIDLKQKGAVAVSALYETLARYPMLTEFTDHGSRPAPVTVILTGDDDAKRTYIEDYPIRHATRDSNEILASDAHASPSWQWYAIAWKSWMERDPARLRALVELAHSKGRRVRVYAIPNREKHWRVALKQGVDLIGGDDLEDLREFLLRDR